MIYPESRFPIALQDWLSRSLNPEIEITWNKTVLQPDDSINGAISITSNRPVSHLPWRDYKIEFSFKLNRPDWEQGRIELSDTAIEIEKRLDVLKDSGLSIALSDLDRVVHQIFFGMQEDRSGQIVRINSDRGGTWQKKIQYLWEDRRGIGRLNHY